MQPLRSRRRILLPLWFSVVSNSSGQSVKVRGFLASWSCLLLDDVRGSQKMRARESARWEERGVGLPKDTTLPWLTPYLGGPWKENMKGRIRAAAIVAAQLPWVLVHAGAASAHCTPALAAGCDNPLSAVGAPFRLLLPTRDCRLPLARVSHVFQLQRDC